VPGGTTPSMCCTRAMSPNLPSLERVATMAIGKADQWIRVW
jgi:hypothetical protein